MHIIKTHTVHNSISMWMFCVLNSNTGYSADMRSSSYSMCSLLFFLPVSFSLPLCSWPRLLSAHVSHSWADWGSALPSRLLWAAETLMSLNDTSLTWQQSVPMRCRESDLTSWTPITQYMLVIKIWKLTVLTKGSSECEESWNIVQEMTIVVHSSSVVHKHPSVLVSYCLCQTFQHVTSDFCLLMTTAGDQTLTSTGSLKLHNVVPLPLKDRVPEVRSAPTADLMSGDSRSVRK